VVTTETSTPISGYFFSIAAFEMTFDQRSSAGSAAMSPSSTRSGKVVPAVRPPFDEVNSVRTTLPLASRMTKPEVSVMAAFVRRSSRTVNFPPTLSRSAAPPYTWQSCVSQSLA